MSTLAEKLAKASGIPSFGRAYDLPPTEEDWHDDGPPILVWVALARAFQHKWLPLYDDMPEPEGILETLDMMVSHLGVTPADVGATDTFLRMDHRDVWSHVSKTKRIRWLVDNVGDVTIEVFRKATDVDAPPVIRVATSRGASDDGGAEVTFDPRVTIGADYGKRHVAVLHTALFALATVPLDLGGISKKKAMMVVKMIAAGAS